MNKRSIENTAVFLNYSKQTVNPSAIEAEYPGKSRIQKKIDFPFVIHEYRNKRAICVLTNPTGRMILRPRNTSYLLVLDFFWFEFISL